jgi:hypothetical protein
VAHKIDVVIAMAMAALAAVERGQNEPRLVTSEWIGVHTVPRSGVGAPAFGGTPEDITWRAAGGTFGGRGSGGSVIW